jgi:hypothetical protein
LVQIDRAHVTGGRPAVNEESTIDLGNVRLNFVKSLPCFGAGLTARWRINAVYTATNVTSPVTWSAIGSALSLNNTNLVITNATSARARFYRLQLK